MRSRSSNYSENSDRNWSGFLAGACVGAAGMFLIDPTRGARRRGVIRDRLAHAGHLTSDCIETTRRDFAQRAQGLWAEAYRRFESEDVPDPILAERVRAKLGRYVSHPHAVEVDADCGCVTLRGQILTHEVKPLLRAVGRIPGVQEVDDLLERHDRAGNIPSLQGGSARPGDRPEVMQRDWSPAARTLVGSAGSAIVAYAAARRDVFGVLFGLAGTALVLRAATNLEARRLVGVGAGRRAVDLQKTITIGAPVSTVFDFWSNFENFPRFMTHVREVSASAIEGQSHWTVAGPAGIPVEFDAVVTEFVPNQVIAWKTLEGAPVAHAGIIHFEPDSVHGTRVHIRFSYNPPAGALGHAVAALLGEDPKAMMDDDLARMKTLIETGNPPRDAAQPMQRAPDAMM
jgi:uncharacterized membrane protein